MLVEMRPIGTIRPYENNLRVSDHAAGAVVESIEDYGWREPIVVAQRDVWGLARTRDDADRFQDTIT